MLTVAVSKVGQTNVVFIDLGDKVDIERSVAEAWLLQADSVIWGTA